MCRARRACRGPPVPGCAVRPAWCHRGRAARPRGARGVRWRGRSVVAGAAVRPAGKAYRPCQTMPVHSARRSSVGDRRVQSRPLTASPSASWTVRSPDECTLVSESRFLLKPVIDNEGGLAQSRCCRLLAWAKDGTTGGASERSWSLSVLSALIVEPFPKVYYEVCFCLKKNNKLAA